VDIEDCLGRYFPGSFNSFLSGKNCESMVDHVLSNCCSCPDNVRSAVEELDRRERLNQKRPAHGSRKRFIFHIWTQLCEIKIPSGSPKEESQVASQKNLTDESEPLVESSGVRMKDVIAGVMGPDGNTLLGKN
jgi:hypothetical protein